MPRGGGKAKRLTDHPAFDHGIAWAPDGKKILFLSDRDGHEDIYLLDRRRSRSSRIRRGASLQGHAADQHAGSRDAASASRPTAGASPSCAPASS